ncbi:hypothetical protein ACHAW5_008022 [Stephanodiscus triporus]|uniref:Subtilisin n=1 Tax=Stephanodiscus triporus TaxID=2934178 RepID=A0ABD3NT69_9STRA
MLSRGGNGLCCEYGHGFYVLRSSDGDVVASGDEYGAIDERIFSIDPNPATDDDDDDDDVEEGFGGTTTTTAAGVRAADQNTWWCGVSWESVASNCDGATPCPGGGADDDCPAGMACYASAPCTHPPTESPTYPPTDSPTAARPTPLPTREPWGEASFADFVYAEGGGDGADGGGAPLLASFDVSAISANLTDHEELRYHFFCGASWTDADVACGRYCPSGDRTDCPAGEDCYANTRCDGRIITAPSVGAAPNAADADPAGASTTGGGNCSLCDRYQKLDPAASIAFQTQTTTCGNLDAMLGVDGILAGSSTCNEIRGTYQNACCGEACRLCQTYGDVLDLRDEHMVMQGGHEASCSEIDGILSESSSSSEAICVDAKTRLADQCCYRQCSLCAIGTMRTEWYNTVIFEGLATTCLGLDYALRAEQVSEGSYRCSELQGEYVSQCCRASGTSCQLCSSGDKLYQIYSDKVIAEPSSNRQMTTTTCAAANDSLARLEKSDQKCTEGLQALFGQCCNLSIVLDDGPDSTSLGEEKDQQNQYSVRCTLPGYFNPSSGEE